MEIAEVMRPADSMDDVLATRPRDVGYTVSCGEDRHGRSRGKQIPTIAASRSLAGACSPRDLFARICAEAVREAEFMLAWVGEVADEELVTVAAASGRVGYLDGLRIGLRIGDLAACGPTGSAFRERRIVTCNDIASTPVMAIWQQKAASHGLGASVAVPLVDGGRVYAVLNVYAERPHSFDGDALARVEQLAVLAVLVHQIKQPEFERLGLDPPRLEEMEARIRHLTEHDSLTGLLHGCNLLEVLDDSPPWHGELRGRAAAAHDTTGALLMVDVDHLALVNHTFGKRAGDEVIKRVASLLSSCAGAADCVARLGGDEFALLLRSGTIQTAARVAEDLRVRLATREGEPPVTCTIGIVAFDGEQGGVTAGEALACARAAVDEGKRRGGDQVRPYSGRIAGTLDWARRVRLALLEGRLVLHAQPILDLRTETIAAHELLIRMIGDSGTTILPGAFLPAAERFGLIREVDDWVVRRGLELTVQTRGRLSINLSGYSVGRREILTLIRSAIANGLDPDLVTFEITETVAVADIDAANAFAAQLTELGCHLALDDFGTGFGSFTYLKRIPTHCVKIDREFVCSLRDSETDRQVVRSIVEISRSLGKCTVAEGVEDRHTLAMLRGFGVDYAQGYLIGPPRAISDTA